MATDSKPLEASKKDDGIVVFPCFNCFCSLNPCDPYVLINKKKSIECRLELSSLHVTFAFFEFQFLVCFYHYLSIAFYVHSIFEVCTVFTWGNFIEIIARIC